MSELFPAHQPGQAADQPSLIAARLRRGVVLPSGRIAGETDRAVHLFPLPAGGRVPNHLTALCGGLVITSGMADMLATIAGMPCPACLALAAGGVTG